MKKNLIELAFTLAFILSVISVLSFGKTCDNIRPQVLRLHVLANSDSKEDQALKLKVRDAVLNEGEKTLGSSLSKSDAQEKIKKCLPNLEKAAQDEIKRNGYSYSVSVEIGESFFPTKTYGDVTLPAGKYDAVRVLIGSAKGHNWWCVMFPNLCLPAAQTEPKMEDVLSKDEIKLVKSKPKYEIRFWIVEKYEQIKEKLAK